nr:hypothetical protein pPsy0462c_00066 [Pseudomonas syringae]
MMIVLQQLRLAINVVTKDWITRGFFNGFITCPYGDGQNVLDSVESLPYHPVAEITAKRLDVQLYNTNAQPILVQCNWKKPLSMDGTIPASIAVALMLEKRGTYVEMG